MENDQIIIEYANTSQCYDGCWTPEITGYDECENEYKLEIDLY